MGAILNGMALVKVRPFGSGFLIFSDYGRMPIRLAAIMEIPVIYVFTHDSIGVGEDGPTHQPIEQLPSLRAIPGLVVLRPADANEVVEAWKVIMQFHHQPAAIILTRQDVPTLDRAKYAPASGLAKGAYVLADAPGGKPDVLLDGLRQRGCALRRGARATHRGGHPIPRRQHAVVGALRRPGRGLSRFGLAPRRHGAGLGRAGVGLRLGEVRRGEGPKHRHASPSGPRRRSRISSGNSVSPWSGSSRPRKAQFGRAKT